jgi:hypothetical protein
MKKLGLAVLAAAMALSVAGDASLAASKKKKQKSLSRDQFTEEQQKKFHEQALAACRKAYGPALSRAVVDYKKRRFVCYLHH